MTDPILGGLLIGVALVFATMMIGYTSWPRNVRLLVGAGLWLRVAGSLTYLFVIGGMYGGGDYLLYYREGLRYASVLADGDLDAALAPWMASGWWGTSATIRLTGLLLALIGPNLAGAFVVYGVVSYVGIVAFWLAFRRSFPQANHVTLLAWVALFPSLWFWPAALGKDAIVLCGVGLATLGYVGNGRSKTWWLLTLGLLLVFVIRPQVAAVVVFAAIAGEFLSVGGRWRLRNTFQATVLAVLAVATVTSASGALGIELFSPERVDAYLEDRGDVLSREGGSALDVSAGRIPIWLAPVNVLFRPFIWEVRGIMPLLAALEVLAMWGLILWRRREAAAFIRHYRRSPLFWFAVALICVYAVAFGMVATNEGLLARQRVHMLPFVFMFVAGAPRLHRPRWAPAGAAPAPLHAKA